jgi:hypothetical protein
MYLIDREKNRINKLEKKSFSELEFTERKHLQEWIANDPTSLGEELLIIQKEFNGFNDTNERLDLLALDKLGNIVVIENKLDDSGRDVTWQIIKYSSYCSSLSKHEIIKIYQDFLGGRGIAEEKISEFFDNKEIDEINLNQGLTSQRLILVAANFRKEITSSVLWLMNFKIRIQCFKVTPFSLDEQLFLTFEQILPTKDTEDFAISMASKSQEEVKVQETTKNRHNIRIEFWEQFLNESNKVNNLFSNNSPTKENWISKGIGMSGVSLNIAISSNYCRSEIIFSTGTQEKNKNWFDYIYDLKDTIEEKFGAELIWERMDENVTCRIKYQLNGVSYFEKNDWKEMNEFLISSSVRMEKAFSEDIKNLNKYSKQK